MKKILILVCLCMHYMVWTAAQSSAVPAFSKTDLIILDASLAIYEHVIIEGQFSTTEGLSGIFHTMWEDKAEKVVTDPTAQLPASHMITELNQDSVLQSLIKQPESSARACVLGQKDTALCLGQFKCPLIIPDGNLSVIFSPAYNERVIAALLAANTGYSTQNSRYVRGATIANLYLVQQLRSLSPRD